MEIYIRITSDDDGYCGWWTFDTYGESYLMDGRALWTISKFTGEEYARGTACTSAREAKREAKVALSIACHDGVVDPKVTFWKQVGEKLIQVKITPDNRISVKPNSVVLKGKDFFEPCKIFP